MKNRTLWQLWSLLTEAEQVHMGQWLQTELGETQVYIQRLYRCLLGQTTAPTPAALWQALYPDAPFNDDRLRKLMRDLSQWLEVYLATRTFLADPEARDRYLLRGISQRGGKALFEHLLRRIWRRHSRRPDRSAAFFRQQFLLETEQWEHQLSHHYQAAIDPAPLQRALERWWLHERMELLCLEAAQAHRQGSSVTLNDPLLSYAQAQATSANLPALRLYLEVYHLLRGDSDKDAQVVREQLQAVGSQIQAHEQRNLLNLLLNYHIGALNAAESDLHAREILNLYQWGLEARILLRDGHLAWNQYKNILTISLRLRMPDVAWAYLHDLRPLLPQELREDAYQFNLGQYYFSQGRFAEVIATYREQRFALPLYDVQARAYLLQAHYEQEGPGTEWLISMTESALRYVREQQLPPLHQKGYQNFFRLLRRLMAASTPAAIGRLTRILPETQPLPH
ncbi:MAG: hypothetical protein D6722_05355, partial [Bacteroidetes bacterium]